ncbi:PfkB family carbohydrate kinase [Deinococcus hopiensis]|uniref:Fructoselysine 6-kinase n=1 Tax=Deinococcus hopiensis KR-140 TaxID=695939 RepID=A0A1W1VUM0_9DEIO|nr:PfkB family carbohydrate kinase [Deinococcus hopiensis]SMB97082.1 fructoselysine 6-kinase [Deinococcus hopiensis KR-140]
MRRLLGLGDNTADLYVDQNVMYPGGNTVNVAVLTARLGHPASYLGVLGDDPPGHLILRALRQEGVETAHTRMVQGQTSWSKVRHRNNDRIFEGSDAGVSTTWQLTDQDFAFIARHEVVHTSAYSGLEPLLPQIRDAAPRLSFDFSSEWTADSSAALAPMLDVAFFSASHQPEEACVALAQRMISLGTEIVVMTRGEQGALAITDRGVHRGQIVPTTVVDTLGAGDAFIAGFLNTWISGDGLGSTLHAAAQEAAKNCATHGAFGYGTPYTPAETPPTV